MNESKGPRWIDLNVEQRAGSARAVRPRPDTWWDIVGPKGPADLEISSALGHGAERRPGDEGRHQEAILPGGTANVMSKELGIPPLLRDACNVLCGNYAVRTVDMGRVGNRIFALRVAVGLEATRGEDGRIRPKVHRALLVAQPDAGDASGFDQQVVGLLRPEDGAAV